jgi:hypothetical protein
MTDPQRQPGDVHIDRLVLDIPGLDPAHVRRLAEGIAASLGNSGARGQHGKVEVPLAVTGTTPDLAQRIVAALMQRLT